MVSRPVRRGSMLAPRGAHAACWAASGGRHVSLAVRRARVVGPCCCMGRARGQPAGERGESSSGRVSCRRLPALPCRCAVRRGVARAPRAPSSMPCGGAGNRAFVPFECSRFYQLIRERLITLCSVCALQCVTLCTVVSCLGVLFSSARCTERVRSHSQSALSASERCIRQGAAGAVLASRIGTT